MQHIEENLLDQYALGTLSPESIAELEEHLLVCSFCQSRLVEADELLILFREAATLEDASTTPRWRNAFAFRTSFWSGAAAALTALLILLITGDSHRAKLPPAILLMQSLRGPEAGAKMASARPILLVFDMAVQASRDYEIGRSPRWPFSRPCRETGERVLLGPCLSPASQHGALGRVQPAIRIEFAPARRSR
jgi:hypothetical protein